ncbi:hypothetical protein D9615_010622 [Tricholomella constricta]|uniref:Uncharacterized protein n=1 Tax=Tricholomella constricta TaxID=117010 RepID=A0A8H5GKK6_9AGAR|nr:hypothetical protein D9615_010622 [Tricholomella constricta]
MAMDVSMLFMGGLEATELIWSYEMHCGPAPIIALAAHAMIGECERCLQAGNPKMDDRITTRSAQLTLTPTEPLRREDLPNAINKLTGERGAAKHLLLRRPPTMSQNLLLVYTLTRSSYRLFRLFRPQS